MPAWHPAPCRHPSSSAPFRALSVLVAVRFRGGFVGLPSATFPGGVLPRGGGGSGDTPRLGTAVLGGGVRGQRQVGMCGRRGGSGSWTSCTPLADQIPMNLAPYVQCGGRRTTHPSRHHRGMRSPSEWDGVGTDGAIIGTSHPIRDHQKGSFWEEGPS